MSETFQSIARCLLVGASVLVAALFAGPSFADDDARPVKVMIINMFGGTPFPLKIDRANVSDRDLPHPNADSDGNRRNQNGQWHLPAQLVDATQALNLCRGFKLQGLTWLFVELTRHFVQIGLRVPTAPQHLIVAPLTESRGRVLRWALAPSVHRPR
jgi:hypothetical protein